MSYVIGGTKPQHIGLYFLQIIGRNNLNFILEDGFMFDTATKEFDVIICGAGPAGSTCALALANSGLRVAVLEKKSFPRGKTCGDAVAAYVPKVLATIDSSLTRSLEDFTEKVSVNTCRLVAPNQRAFDLRFSQTGFISRRIDWDNFLFEKASAQNNT